MGIDSKTFLKDLKTINGQLTTIITTMNSLVSGFEPPPDPDKPGLLAQLNLITTSLATISADNNTWLADVNASP
jgi:hypothetical protein